MKGEHPTPHLSLSSRVKSGPVPSTPGAGGAEESKNAKKRKLNWHFKCLQAAGLDVKFPEEG